MIKLVLSSLIALGASDANAMSVNTRTETVSPAKSEIVVVKDLNANTKPYIYFSLVTGKDVPAGDSKTDKWDVAFSKTTITVNGGTSGPGQGGAQVLEKSFDQVSEAPKDGYKTDGESGSAIPGGSGNSWYKYDMSVHAILPIVGRTILVKTAAGRFAKIEIISYYKGAPEEVPTEESSYFTFRYSLADENGKF
ncbi:HmuY family protein [Dyadobacter sp. CY312]|uniref:HmuY family protein n=1 Tax=Dyadobacter sp. CY312 TaxID=2907303 RepID=UPI001F21B647|nr:HmuY family protein [Dyadobacter sp. CY312]MCE7043516.1 HmuY family protein [Dyadobacter sp. CY312]